MNMQINVTSPAATSFIYFLIGENYFYVLYLFYLFVFFTSSKILFLNKNCLVTVHFLFFVLSDPSIYWCIIRFVLFSMQGGSDCYNKMVCSVQWCCNHCVKNTSITVNKYRFCISVIGHINKQSINIGRSLIVIANSTKTTETS